MHAHTLGLAFEEETQSNTYFKTPAEEAAVLDTVSMVAGETVVSMAAGDTVFMVAGGTGCVEEEEVEEWLWKGQVLASKHQYL